MSELTFLELDEAYWNMTYPDKAPKTLYVSPLNYAFIRCRLQEMGYSNPSYNSSIRLYDTWVLIDKDEPNYRFTYEDPLPNDGVYVTL